MEQTARLLFCVLSFCLEMALQDKEAAQSTPSSRLSMRFPFVKHSGNQIRRPEPLLVAAKFPSLKPCIGAAGVP